MNASRTAPPPPAGEAPAVGVDISTELQQAQDRAIVDQCLTGSPGAWDHLYHSQNPSLLAFIRGSLGACAADTDLVNELAARVWYSLVRNRGLLLDRYDAKRGCRLATFLAVLAKTEISQHFRAERRRKARESVAASSESHPLELSVEQIAAAIDDFLETLTPREREFCEHDLLGAAAEGGISSFSQSNAWQLRHRVRRKLNAFLTIE